jgi:hypothetical protein
MVVLVLGFVFGWLVFLWSEVDEILSPKQKTRGLINTLVLLLGGLLALLRCNKEFMKPVAMIC